jgi:DNA-binding response OmpR family regulator
MRIIEITMARVLVVEDEPNIGAIIVFKLEREGHTVTWVTEAARVADAAAALRPDLVLLDSTLPDGDAFLLLERLVQRGPVVMLTEFRDAAAPERARRAGAAATVEKPFKPTQLARLVAQLAPVASA